ncbi:anthranilate synthase component I [Thermoplasma sp.]|uniref:anthranilate synthase component I n=1 Tax=Thermoplasma sp. TaxID=1973142 RepID=UPI001282AA8D|nr:anthranilate synthase component I [Thermoplasma sp.]KAA8921976.1 MAG: anthranilate synthase component I [Thermoplasma sp.]
MNLIDELSEYKDRDSIAYFASFPDRVSGYEYAFIGSGMITDPERIFDGRVRPLVVTYDFVNSVFGEKIRRSGWPEMLSFDPDTVIKRKIARDGSFIKKDVGDFSDPDLAERIAEVRQLIRSGELLQAVISREFEACIDPWDKLREFVTHDRSRYVFYYRIGRYQIVGSSPENLVTVVGNEVYTDPIAGTVPSTVSSSVLTGSSKDASEHRMLLDLARNDLSKFAEIGSLGVSKVMQIEEFSSVKHLVSQVRATFSNTAYIDILKAMFPAGTVSGSPKERAIEIIERYEERPRGPYGGAIGITMDGMMDLALTIRSAYSDGDGFRVRAGAGIVKDSDPEAEVHEIYSKARSVI